MIDFLSFPLDKGVYKSLHDTSYDKSRKEYMTDDTRKAVAVDILKKAYIRKLRIQGVKSADAATNISSCGTVIEFKNGNISNEDISDIEGKMIDSIDVLTYYTSLSNEQIKHECDFILVINLERSTHVSSVLYGDQEDIDSKSISGMKLHLNDMSKTDKALFGLLEYEGKYYNRVKTMSKQKFNMLLQQG